MTQDDLDDAFRANSARGELDPTHEDWPAMATLLRRDERRRRWRAAMSLLWIALFLGLIAGGIAGLVRLSPKPTSTAAGAVATESHTPARLPAPPADRASAPPSARPPVDAPSKPIATTPYTPADAPSATRNRVDQRGATGAALGVGVLDSRAPANAATTPESRRSRVSNPPHSPRSTAAASDSRVDVAPTGRATESEVAALFPHETAVAIDAASDAASRGSALLRHLPARPLRALTTAGLTPAFVFAPRRVAAPAPPSARFRLALLGAGALHQVAMAGPLRAGGGAGVQLARRLGSRWRATVGLGYAVERYVATGSQIDMPQDLFVDGNLPEEVRSACGVLEFPLGVGFAPRGWQSRGAHFGAQVASHLLLRDRMHFAYATTRPGQLTEMITAEMMWHPLSSLRLQAGYLVPLGARSMVRASPFVELPFGKTGYGQVALYSAGLQVAIEL